MTSKKFNLELIKAKREISKICKKENYIGNVKLEINKCIICSKYPEKIFIKKILYKKKQYINYPVYLCQRCGMAQQLFKFDNKFHNYYYKKIISKNLKINELILNNNFKLSYQRGKFLFDKFNKFLPKRKLKILDLGSGTGGLLKYFNEKGHNVFGLEPNFKYYKYSKKFLKNIINENFEDRKYKNNFFDLILIIGTLEHVNNAQKTIKMINKITKKNSIIIIDSKGYPNDMLKNYFNFNHHRCFTKKTIELFLSNAGWKKRYLNYSNSYGNLKVDRKIYDKNEKGKPNLKGNIIGYLEKKSNKIKINYSKDILFSSLYK